MELEENKDIIRRLVKAFNKHNVALLDEFIASDFVDHTIQLQGLENYKKFENMFIKGFPDYHETIEDIIAEGDNVWIHFKVTGTHTGEWNLFGVTIPPTGKKVSYRMVFNWRVVNGKLVEGGEVDDNLPFLKELGFIEYTEKGKPLENIFK